MEKIFKVFAAALLLIFVAPILGVFFGAFSGWVVGLVFEDAIRSTLGSLGLNPATSMWQIGATLGFVGGFFRVVKGGASQ